MPPVGYCGEVVTLSTSSFSPPPFLFSSCCVFCVVCLRVCLCVLSFAPLM